MADRHRARPILMMVTDRRRLAGRIGLAPDSPDVIPALVARIAAVAEAGVDLVQIRERDLEGRALLDLTARAVEAVRGSGTRIVVNDRVDVAIAAGAHGAHLPSAGLTPAQARALMPRPALIGVSIHAPAPELNRETLDYAVFGTVYPTRSKPDAFPVAGIAGLRDAVAGSSVPTLAIGGVTAARAAEVALAGAAGIAAIDLFLPGAAQGREESLRKTVESVHEMFDTVRDVS